MRHIFKCLFPVSGMCWSLGTAYTRSPCKKTLPLPSVPSHLNSSRIKPLGDLEEAQRKSGLHLLPSNQLQDQIWVTATCGAFGIGQGSPRCSALVCLCCLKTGEQSFLLTGFKVYFLDFLEITTTYLLHSNILLNYYLGQIMHYVKSIVKRTFEKY